MAKREDNGRGPSGDGARGGRRGTPPAKGRAGRGPAPGGERGLPGGLRLVFEDEEVLVVDKPTGLLSAGVPGQEIDSAFNFVKAHVRSQARRRGTRVWIVHRLDKEASGLLVFAKTEKAFEWLKEDFRAKRVHRLYAAVVEGEIGSAGGNEPRSEPVGPGRKRPVQPAMGTIQSYLIEDATGLVRSVQSPVGPRDPKRRDDDDERGDAPKLAVTHWRVQYAGHARTLLQVRLETGRKNQIRVHMRDFGHPIVGDRRYGALTDPIERVCLHATELGFNHPTTGRMTRFQSPPPAGFYVIVGVKPADAASLQAEERVAAPEGPTTTADTAPEAIRVAKDPAPTTSRGPTAPAPVPAPGSTSWDHVAEWYNEMIQDRKSDHHERVIMPGTLRLLRPAAGMHVLDVACGQGQLARRLAEQGVRVTGIDASPRLIDAARKAGQAAGVEYHVRDAATLDGLEAGPFDAAACVMALMNMEPIGPVLHGVASKLAPGGACVAVILHPAFRAPGQTSWGWTTDEPDAGHHDGGSRGAPLHAAARQFRRVDGYLSIGQRAIVMNPGGVARGGMPVTTLTFHRPLQAYVKAFAEAGLLIESLEEWPSLRSSAPGPRSAEENRARREIPMFLGIRAIKVGGGEGRG